MEPNGKWKGMDQHSFSMERMDRKELKASPFDGLRCRQRGTTKQISPFESLVLDSTNPAVGSGFSGSGGERIFAIKLSRK